MLDSIIARSRSGLVAGLVALSVATLPAPRAEAQDNGQIAAGIATLAILGALIAHQAKADEERDKKRDKQDKKRVVSRGYAPPPAFHRHTADHAPDWRTAPPRQQHAHRPAPPRNFWEHHDKRRDHDRRHDHDRRR